jgi:hypothetical protein
MGIRGAFAAGTVISVAVTAVWSWTAAAATGPTGPLHLGRDPLADYAQLADAATGSGLALFAVVAAVYFACFLVSGLRYRKHSHLAAENRRGPSQHQNHPARRSVSE